MSNPEKQYQDYLKRMREGNYMCLVESLSRLGPAIWDYRVALEKGEGPAIFKAIRELAWQAESVRFHLWEHLKGEPQ